MKFLDQCFQKLEHELDSTHNKDMQMRRTVDATQRFTKAAFVHGLQKQNTGVFK